MSREEIEKLLEKKNSFYRIGKPLGIWKLYTQHSNNPIELEIYQNFNRKGHSPSGRPTYLANLVYSDERMVKTKNIGGMHIGLEGNSVASILSQAIQKIEDFYDPKKSFL